MQITTRATRPQPAVTPSYEALSSRQLYEALLQSHPSADSVHEAREYLEQRLDEAAKRDADLPEDPRALEGWIAQGVEQVGNAYRDYLASRKAGAPRRYFKSKSHALYFLKGVAPTKLVDGAWLYGLLQRWNDPRFSAPIQIYLEELGEGQPDKNHVVLYKKLLATNGCDDWASLSDEHYVQGAIQLALAHHADHFLPEVIGFNLGYEQLPLHLLITAYELNELGLDPYYFTLHITVDNAGTGHAKKALQALYDAMPVENHEAFYQRVINGYKLNLLGEGTTSVIAGFDLEQEVIDLLAEKSTVGKYVHSDYCRIGGRSVTDWLSNPEQIPGFLESLQAHGWIKRHQDPMESRFWKLIQGERAEMFGVFSPYEQQLLHDWIAGDLIHTGASRTAESQARVARLPKRELSFRAKQRQLETLCEGQGSETGRSALTAANSDASSDFDSERNQLAEKLAAQPSREAGMAYLIEMMAPATHHTASGLLATRLFTQLFS
ncbi:heme oxygenase-like protein [Pseudomonas duriflava]|uniref:Heme oxygenase-like protein n=1 Tax=Pseudomonas duriflava TaxID=459528 RepID=A0A562QFF8_9PSED|nr:iron-containing redox enzyme family protein [Pseudomonas duriflava]TWI55478.1 heme oxygenase-like protein [Pseudomonas duriflava]